jgi:eukaryotic-like serine/threonine-protein kinase
MNEQLWIEIEEAYTEAAALPPDARTTFLNEFYRDRPDIRREVESLLEHQLAGEKLKQSAVVEAAAEMFIEDEAELIGTVIAGKYLIRECLGAGGMAEVYLADHIALNVPVALKRPKPGLKGNAEFRKSFLEEARRAVVLNDENVARVHDVVEDGDDMFVVMEYIEGETLRRRLSAIGRPFTVEEFLPIAIQCASALAAAHEKRIVHLDVKPENIMLTPAGKVKICDFGIARRLSKDASRATTLIVGASQVMAGTPAYMPPEVVLGNPVDERADLFSLGVVFYEILAGHNPFKADTIVATTNRIVSHKPLPLSSVRHDIDPKLERIITKMLAKRPDQRGPGARELVHELTALSRSRHRLHDIAQNVREAFTESRRLTVAAAIVLLCLFSLPIVWIYRDDIEERIGLMRLPDRKIVVVLPFQVIGDSRDERFYSEGVSEILTSRLTQLTGIPDLQVVPSTAIREGKVDTVEKARAEFGATIVLAGMFQISGDQVRISYSLIRAADRHVLRSAIPKTVSAADPLSLQDVVAQDFISMLKVELTPAAEAMLQEYGTRNMTAFFLYTEGLGALANYQDLENVEKAINLFTQATEQDDKYADAYAALGRSYWQKFSKLKEPAWLNLARTDCEKASSLEQRLSEAQVCLGLVNESAGDHELAIEYYQRAIEYSPTNDDAHRALGSALEELQRFDEAEQTYLKAIQLRPQYWASHSWMAVFYNRRHQNAKAIEHFYDALALSPDNGQVCYSLALAYLDDGQYDNAIQFLQKSAALRPYVAGPYGNLGLTYLRHRQFKEAVAPFERAAELQEDYRSDGNLARIYWLVGRTDEARQKYELAIRDGEKLLQQNPRDHGVHLLVGRYYAMLGKKPEAVSHIELALHLHADDPHYLSIAATAYVQLGDRNNALSLMEQAVRFGYTAVQIAGEPELDVLKGEPRYAALMSTTVNGR